MADFSPVLFRLRNITRDRKGVCKAPGEPYFLLFLAYTMESGRRDCVGSGGGGAQVADRESPLPALSSARK